MTAIQAITLGDFVPGSPLMECKTWRDGVRIGALA
jgi:hypothetical protein